MRSASASGHRRLTPRAALLAILLATATCQNPFAPDEATSPGLSTSTGPFILFGAGDIAGCGSNGDEQTATLLDGLFASTPDAKVFADGDVIYDDGTASEFQNCYHPSWGRFKSKTVPVLGNHEYNTGTARAYFDYFNGGGADSGRAGKRGKGYYSFDAGAWHIVVLNANHDFVATDRGSTQEVWLRNDLAATSQPCILALWHQPRFHSTDESPAPGPTSYVLDFWKDLYAAGADLVINGHQHYYERYAPQDPYGKPDPDKGIRQIIVGTGGKSVSGPSDRRPNSVVLNGNTYGVIRLSLSNGSYTWKFIPVAGKSFTDTGTGTCHGSSGGSAPPVAGFGSSCTNLSCSFTDQSSDPDGTIESWSWKFGDGATSTSQNPAHTYAAAGTYGVTLTVTDEDGVSDAITQQVPVGTAPTTGGGGAWSTRPPMPTARYGLTAATIVNGSGQPVIYAVGGFSNALNTNLGKVEAYNVVTGSWTTKAVMPSPRREMNGGGVINGKLYLSGGVNASGTYKTLFVYDPSANTWSQKAAMPVRSGNGVSAVLNARLYVLVGNCYDCATVLTPRLYRYDPVTNAWTARASAPHPHAGGAGGVIDGKFYVAGGSSSALDVYDPSSNTWSTRASMPVTGSGQAAVIGKLLYVVTGRTDGKVEVYDPVVNRWSETAALPTPRSAFAVARLTTSDGHSKVAVLGGRTSTTPQMATHQVYTP